MSRKTFSLKKSSSVDKKISLFAMISIALLAIFNFQNVIDNYVGLGLSATVAFAIAVVVFLFPFIFIIAEFASLQKGTKSGLTSWIKVSVGRKIAFLTSFMFWFANLTYFFSAIPLRVNYLSFAITGENYTENQLYNDIVPWASVAFFFIITLISTLNTKKLSKLTSLGGALMIGVTVFFFVFAIIGWIAGAINPNIMNETQAPGVAPDDKLDYWGRSGGLGFGWISTFIWVLMAADGGQSLGVYVNDVKGGRKTFIRAMLISVSLIGFAYVAGTLLTSVFPPTGGLAAGWANSFVNLFYFILNPLGVDLNTITKLTNIVIGLIFFISSIGGIIVWTSAPVKVMFSEIQSGIFGQKLSKENKFGVCSFGTWVQFIIVTPLMLFLMLSKGDLSESLALIKGAAGWIGMLPWIVIFVSYVNLRVKKEFESRSFKLGNRTLGISIGIFLCVVTLVILFLTFFDTTPLNLPFSEWPSDWYLGVVLKLVMILLILVPAYLWYYFKFEYQIRDSKAAKAKGISENSVILKYNFLSDLKYKFLYTERYQEFEKRKNQALFDAKSKVSKLHEIDDNLQKQINETSDKNEVKELKLQKKRNVSEIKGIEKGLKVQLKTLKTEFKNEINEVVQSERSKHEQEYQLIMEYLQELKQKEISNKNDATQVVKVKEARNELKNSLKELKKSYSQKNISKIEFNQKQNEIFEKLYSINLDKPHRELMLKDLDSSIKKDIDFDDLTIEKYFDDIKEKSLFESSIVYHYSIFDKKEINAKIAISKNKLLLVQTHSNSLVAKEYDLKNSKFILKSVDNSIAITNNGNWINLDKVELVYGENAQLESFVFYIEDSKKLMSVLG